MKKKKKNHYRKVIPLASFVENLYAGETDLLLGPIHYDFERRNNMYKLPDQIYKQLQIIAEYFSSK